MQITVLAGGVGGAKFLRGVRAACATLPSASITAVVNTGDDVTMHGLRITPDLDSVMYALAGVNDTDRGWGRTGESWRIQDELRAYGAEPSWFSLGDLDIATHLVRTRMLDAGYPLSDVTAALCARWLPAPQSGGDGPPPVTLLPMTDQRCETHVLVDAGEVDVQDAEAGEAGAAPRRRAIHFQEWWVRHRAGLPAHGFVQVGLDDAEPAPGVLEAIHSADVVLVAPSNPVVSIGTILAVPGIRDALRSARGRVVGYSPIVGGTALRGMADVCLAAIGVEVSAEGVGRHYGSRRGDGILDAWFIAEQDTASVPGVQVRAIPLLMTDDDATAAMVRAGLL